MKNRYETSLAIQDASNVRAVLSTLRDLYAECPDWTDPANILLLSKFASMLPYNLTCIGTVEVPGESSDPFRSAYMECLKRKEVNA